MCCVIIDTCCNLSYGYCIFNLHLYIPQLTHFPVATITLKPSQICCVIIDTCRI